MYSRTASPQSARASDLHVGAIPERADAIPSIDLATIYDPRFAREDIQYGSLGILADLLGRSPIPHRHDDFLQIQFVETGHFELRLDTVHYRARGPALFLTPPAVPHAFTLSPDARGHVLTMRQNLAWSIAERDRSLPDRENPVSFCVEFKGMEGRRQARELSLTFRLLQREMSSDRPGNDTVCAGLAQAILAQSLRAQRQDGPAAASSERDLVRYRRFLQLVEGHFREHWPVSRFAGELGMTEWRLHEIASLCGGTTPKAIARERLLQEAKRQLAFSSASIKEISAHLGFSDSPYFCRFFKRMHGQTPSEYRLHVLRGVRFQKSPTDSQPAAL